MEQVRIVRDQIGWATFDQTYNAVTEKCYSLVNTNPNAITMLEFSCATTFPDVPGANAFKYVIKILNNPTGCSTNCKRVTVSVSWSDASCSGGSYCHKSELISYLSRWQ